MNVIKESYSQIQQLTHVLSISLVRQEVLSTAHLIESGVGFL